MGRRVPVFALKPAAMLRSLLPRSLRARMVLLTLGTILLVQAATFTTISYYRKQFTEEVAVEFTATTIRTLRAALAEIPVEQRADFVRRASQNQWHLWSRSLPPDASLEERRPPPPPERRRGHRPPPPPASDIRNNLRSFVQALNRRLSDDTRVALSRGPEPRLYISMLSDSGLDETSYNREWLVIPLDRIAPPVATPMIIVWLTGMGLFLLLSAAFSWHITRPLTRLAKAADQLAAGQPQRVTPSGPSETRILGERFNAMLDTLAESSAVQRTLLAGLPHDLKGPLSRMWLRIEMVDDPTFKEGMRNDVQDMQRMVNQFIGFVRGSDPGSYQFAPLALNTWLEEQISAWESAGSPVKLVRMPPGILRLDADKLALGRLMDNLITNALNHGQAPVEIALEAQDGHARITVSDHGPGISAERRVEALRPFSRLDEARTLTGSVGLGLALAEAIVKAHHGSLALGQAPWGGLEVSILLPLADTAT
ncbi:ATP-binding protein [Pollutimonas bauzanensis]|uniref:histidine kinase n=1 Tax=Pollutimonas bauzanensis TaxID=658167 RepID=A0A1M5X2B9_9BURK|nr:ATP-binding protein [Pollutimonas bauzanensis]SHH93363.1 two-component system, OmpR family, osmolarity sensor histidine kinase EnvZ [Pollutimonas bauzanensis]